MSGAPQRGRTRVGVVIVTHGEAGGAMLAAARGLLGTAQLEGFVALGVGPGEERGRVQQRLDEAVRAADGGAGVLVLCDLYGATPANCAAALRDGGKIEVLAGVNLPMLVKVATLDRRALGPAELARAAAETATKSIRPVGGERP